MRIQNRIEKTNARKKKNVAILTMAIMLIGIQPMVAISSYAADQSIAINDSTSSADIQVKIDACSSGDTLVVTGNASNSTGFSLDIPAGVTVLWKASYICNANDHGLSLTGGGTFDVAEGGRITGTGNGKINAVYVNSSSLTLIISGGLVQSTGARNMTIYSRGSVTITGGRVLSTSPSASTCLLAVNITMSSGLVKTESGTALYVDGSLVLTGGTVISTEPNGSALYIDKSANGASVSGGGALVAQGQTLDDVASVNSGALQLGTGGIAIAYDPSTSIYIAGSSTDIQCFTVNGSIATAVWALEGGSSGIRYMAGSSTGFVSIDGVTVTTPLLSPAATPTASIHYEKELLIGFEPNLTVTINGKLYTSSSTGTIPIEEGWFSKTLEIVRKGDGQQFTDSAPQSLHVPARPGVPTGVTAVDETAAGKSDGKLEGVSSDMEYRLKGETDFKPIAGTELANLPPGVYEVRVKAKDANSFPGIVAEFTIGAGSNGANLDGTGSGGSNSDSAGDADSVGDADSAGESRNESGARTNLENPKMGDDSAPLPSELMLVISGLALAILVRERRKVKVGKR